VEPSAGHPRRKKKTKKSIDYCELYDDDDDDNVLCKRKENEYYFESTTLESGGSRMK
jgi:hypothetical protein